MPTDDARFEEAIRRIDAANAADPRRVSWQGADHPLGLLYAQRMTEWLDRLEPGAPEPLRLAARAQHIRRWEIPRDSFPMDRTGYLRWRTTLYEFHADRAAEILREVGYDAATIQQVRDLLMKKRIKADPLMQTLEDVICLVFLQHEFAAFAAEHAADEPKIINILQRTWKKMSAKGHAAALQLAPQLPDGPRSLVTKALAP
jgi:hypothetical protein